MQDQGKRLLLAVGARARRVAAVAEALPAEEEPKPPPGAGSGSGCRDGRSPAASQPTLAGRLRRRRRPSDARRQLDHAEVPERSRVTFSNIGGALTSWHLTDPRYERRRDEGRADRPATASSSVEFAKDSTFKLPKRRGVDRHEGRRSPGRVQALDRRARHREDVRGRARLRIIVTHDGRGHGEGTDAHQRSRSRTISSRIRSDTGGGSSRVQPRVWNSSTLRGGDDRPERAQGRRRSTRGYEQNISGRASSIRTCSSGSRRKPVLNGGTIDKHTYADDKGIDADRPDLSAGRRSSRARRRSRARSSATSARRTTTSSSDADTAAGFATGFQRDDRSRLVRLPRQAAAVAAAQVPRVVGNWGVAIILLTVCVKLATLYWTTKSMRSMKAMAVLGPQIKELQEKYKDDKQRLQIETMALYKQQRREPALGLPADVPADADLDRALPDAVERGRAVSASRSSPAGSTI